MRFTSNYGYSNQLCTYFFYFAMFASLAIPWRNTVKSYEFFVHTNAHYFPFGSIKIDIVCLKKKKWRHQWVSTVYFFFSYVSNWFFMLICNEVESHWFHSARQRKNKTKSEKEIEKNNAQSSSGIWFSTDDFKFTIW